ncbi:hypothetical protein [Streptomyces albireticuli]|nr:hypothetical protein [Streptomyces albireticuli]MCD9194574.1 hypothetical protein [Streptomyces albireticuli]
MIYVRVSSHGGAADLVNVDPAVVTASAERAAREPAPGCPRPSRAVC